jgi:putative glycosyltransferase
MKDISVITTTYNSSNTIRIFDQQIRNQLLNLGLTFEVIYVDDGSSDNTPDILNEICRNTNDTRAIILSRNFGQHKALWAGISKSSGKWSFITDSDLEESPSNFQIFWQAKEANPDIDLFLGRQSPRRGRGWGRFIGSITWKFISRISDTHIPADLVTSRLFSSGIRDAIISFSEKEIFIAHTFAYTGFRQHVIPIAKLSLNKSHYTLAKKLKVALDGITNTSIKPLYFTFIFGVFFEVLALLLILNVIFQKVKGATDVDGWTTLVVLNLFTGGVILLSIGIVALYISRIFLEVKGKPSFIVRDEY